MLALSAEKRRELLNHYMAYEPTMKVNGGTYHVHAIDLPNLVLFIALNARMQWIEGAVVVPRDFFETINNGMTMAWLTMTAYDDLEESVKSGEVRVSLQALAADGGV